jgi:hypothetical protein
MLRRPECADFVMVAYRGRDTKRTALHAKECKSLICKGHGVFTTCVPGSSVATFK